MRKFSYRKLGFSLAEVLIVVSIIGMIASIMVPALDNTRPDELTLNYRKAFFSLEAAVANIANNPAMYEAEGDPPRVDFTRPIISGATTADPNGLAFCRNLAKQLNTLGTVRCPGEAGLTNLNLDNGTNPAGENLTRDNYNFIIGNGVTVGGLTPNWSSKRDNTHTDFDVPAGDPLSQFITLCVDVNGLNAGPNVGCAAADRAIPNRDQYRVRVSRDGRVYTGAFLGPNNWYAENIMLINPRKIFQDRRKWSDEEASILVLPAAAEATTIDLADSRATYNGHSLELLGYKWVPSARRWTFLASPKSSMGKKK